MAFKILTTLIIILPHLFVGYSDYFAQVEGVDFIKRVDGSMSNPKELLTGEVIAVSIIGLIYFVIACVGILSLPPFKLFSLKQVGLVAFIIHLLWVFHMIARIEEWQDWFHPRSKTLTFDFLLTVHIVWAIFSFVVVLVNKDECKSKVIQSLKQKKSI